MFGFSCVILLLLFFHWHLYEESSVFYKKGQRSIMRAMFGEHLFDRKRSKDLMFMLHLNETIDKLTVLDSVGCSGNLSRG